MSKKIRKQIVRCPDRGRDVEVSYEVSGKMFARKYEIIDCPAIRDGAQSCNRLCWSAISNPPRYLDFTTNRV